MTEQPYRPMTEAPRYYPGRIRPEREAEVDSFRVDIEDLDLDDLFAHISKAPYRYWYRMLKIVRDRWGEDAMNEVVEDFGYRGGVALYRAMQKRFGTITPEAMARYQDLAHFLMGRDMVDTSIELSENECVVRRRRCSFHANAPAGMEHLCDRFNSAALRAYMDEDPRLRATRPCDLAAGDDYCEHRFLFADVPAGPSVQDDGEGS